MYLNLLSELKAAIINRESLSDESIAALALQYRQACENVNRRLIGVSSLLKLGLRDEAVQVADHPRKLLDSLRELNFSQREDWVQVLSDKCLEVPPQFEFPAAVELEQAYQKLETLAPLLKKNRLLAMSHAPLKPRIMILKKLIEMDPENPAWKLDLSALEEARLLKIKEELRRAKKSRDGSKLRELVAELGGAWTVPVPRALVADTNQAFKDAGVESFVREMEGVAEGLQKCLLESDEEAALPLRAQWMKLNKVVNLSADDPLVEKAREPLGWLEGIHQQRVADSNYQQATTDLERGIESGVPVEELDRRTALVQNFDRETSADLLSQSQASRKTIVSAQQQKKRTVLFSLVGCGVLAALAIGWFWRGQVRQGQIAESRQTLAAFVDGGELESGQSYFDQLAPFVKSDSEISKLSARMAELEKGEAERMAALDEVLGRVDLQGELDGKVDDLLHKARQYAKSEADKERLAGLREDLNAVRKERQADRTRTYQGAAKPLEDRLAGTLKRIESGTALPGSLTTVVKELNALKEGAMQQADGMSGITVSASAQTDALIAAAKEVVGRAGKQKEAATALTKLKQQAVKLRNLGPALARFAKLYPEDPNSREFRTSSQEENYWEGLRQWQGMAKSARKLDIEKLEQQELESLRERMESASALAKFTNWKDSLDKTQGFLDSAVSDRSELFRKLFVVQAFFRQKSHSEIHVLHRDGQRYYLTLANEFQPKSRTFTYFTRGQGQQERKYQVNDLGGLAGHCGVAKDALKQIEGFSGDIDRELLKLLKTTLAESKELTAINGPTIDPLVQAEFIDKILILIEEVSPELRPFATRQRSILRESKVVGLMWRNVLDGAANAARPQADKAIAAIRKNFPDAQKLNVANLGSMKGWNQVADYVPVGLMYRKGKQWIADVAVSVKEGQALYCLLPGRDGAVSIGNVGRYQRGVLVQVDSVLPLQAGRPIFVIADKPQE